MTDEDTCVGSWHTKLEDTSTNHQLAEELANGTPNGNSHRILRIQEQPFSSLHSVQGRSLVIIVHRASSVRVCGPEGPTLNGSSRLHTFQAIPHSILGTRLTQFLWIAYLFRFLNGAAQRRSDLRHVATLVGRREPSNNFVSISGQGRGLPEDVGSHGGWAELKAACATYTSDMEQKEKRKWFGRQASNADPAGLADGRWKK